MVQNPGRTEMGIRTTLTPEIHSIMYMKTAGDYEITINAEANVSYARFCEGLNKSSQGYFEPMLNNYIVELSKFKSDSLTSLDYTFAGLSRLM